MPALPPVPGVLKVEFVGNQGGTHQLANILHFSYTGTAPSNASCATLAADFLAALATGDGTHQLHTLMDNSTEYTECIVTDLTSNTSGTGTYSSNVVGTRGSALLPASASYLISDSIGRRYRGGHPRHYWPLGVAGDLQFANQWSAGFTTVVQDWWAANDTAFQTITNSGTAVSHRVNVSYVTAGARRSTPVVDVITAVTYSPHVRSQRRRLK